MIAMHAVATDDPQRLRWVITGARMPAGGRVRQAPGRLGVLQHDGVIVEMTVHGAEVVITLSPAQRWRDRAEEVRVALDEALDMPAHWRTDPVKRTGELRQAARELLDGPIGEIATAHGGTIELVEVTGDRVRVRLSGACHGCPAAGSTLHDRLQRELRRRFGDAITVSAESASAAKSMGRKLLTLFVR